MALRVELRGEAIELLANASWRRAAVTDSRSDGRLGRQARLEIRRQAVIDGEQIGVADLGESQPQLLAALDERPGDLVCSGERHAAPREPVRDFGCKRESRDRLAREL